MSDATAVRTRRKFKEGRPKPPYDDFPLSPHSSGSWVKKINGRFHYFGRWAKRVNGRLVRIDGDGWKAALELYRTQAPDLFAGRKPRTNRHPAEPTVGDICNTFYEAKKQRLDDGQMTQRAFGDYVRTTDLIVAKFGKDRVVEDLGPTDFRALRAALSRRYGPVRLSNEIGRTKSVFRFAVDNRIIAQPVFYGSEFAKPSMRELRVARATSGKSHLLKPEELRRLIVGAKLPLRAMILLGINCGFGNTDCASLPLNAVDLEGSWVNFPRPKTGVGRQCSLWPETIEALKSAIEARPKPIATADNHLVFITRSRRRWIRESSSPDPNRWTSRTDRIGNCFTALLEDLGLKRKGVGFYSLRHMFETVAGGSKDQVAVDLIMGHADRTMAANYRHGVDEQRIRDVVGHVHHWLFPECGASVAMGDGAPSCQNSAAELK